MRAPTIEKALQQVIAELEKQYAGLREAVASADMSTFESRYRICSQVADHFLYCVSRTGLPSVAAEIVGIPLRYWLEFRDTNTAFAQRLQFAMEEGELALIDLTIQKLPLTPTGARSLRLLLSSRRPERYQVRTILQQQTSDDNYIVTVKRMLLSAIQKLEGVGDEEREKLLTLIDSAMEDLPERQ